MTFRAAYISYADYGGPLIHTREFAKAFNKLVPDLITYFPNFTENLSPKKPVSETSFNKLFSYFPSWSRQLKLEFYQFRKLLHDMAKWRYFANLYRQNNIDILVIRNDAYVIGAIIAAIRIGIPYLLETNGVLVKDKPDFITQNYEKFSWKYSAGIFTVCEPLSNLLIHFGAPKNKIRTITNGVELTVYQHKKEIYEALIPIEMKAKLNNNIVITYVGTFTDYHDLTSLLKGFKESQKVIPNLRLLLVGEGKNNNRIQNLCIQLNLSNQILFTGRVPPNIIPAYLNISNILVLPLKQIYEEGFHGAPIKLFEYMAAARPIIATDMPSIRDIIGNNAKYVLPGRDDKWAEAIIELSQSPEYREKLGSQAYQHLIDRGYTWEDNAKKVFRFCESILSKIDN